MTYIPITHDFFGAECIHCGCAKTPDNRYDSCRAGENHWAQLNDPDKNDAAKRTWEERPGTNSGLAN